VLAPQDASFSSARVEPFDAHLHVYFGDASPRHADFHYRWLRHNCDGDLHPKTRERLLDSSEIPRDIRPERCSIDAERGALIVTWAGEDRTSVFPLAWLREHAYAPDRSAQPPPADAASVTFDAAELSDDDAAAQAIARVERDGVAVALRFRRGVDPEGSTDAIVDALARAGLFLRSTHFGHIEDLRTDNTTNKNTDQLGYTDAAVNLHTDQPFLEVPPRYQLLQCIRPSDEGGENQVADALQAARYLAQIDAHAHALLRSVPVRFHRKQRSFEAIVDSPMLVGEGADFRVRSSYFTLAPYRLPFEEMEAWYDAHERFTRLLRDPRYHYSLRLGAGDFLLYDNWRMLHARSSFRGARWLRGIYFDREAQPREEKPREGLARAMASRGPPGAPLAAAPASLGEVVLAGLLPCVNTLERQIRLGRLSAPELAALGAWQARCQGTRTPRSLAADAVLLALCDRISGAPQVPGAARIPGAPGAPGALAALRDRCPMEAPLVDASMALCRADPAMLGPLYEALSSRRDRYALGQYFTPAPLREFMAGLVRDAGAERVLDPAVGAGSLLASLAPGTTVVGYDPSPICAALAAAGLRARGFSRVEIREASFLEETPTSPAPHPPAPRPPQRGAQATFDAVICNPPYLRHHLLAAGEKARLAARYRARLGLEISALSTSYVYFFLEALGRVRDGGLLVFVVPADFLDARFGEGLKRALVEQTRPEQILLFDRERLAFDGVLTTSAIVVARKGAPPRGHTVALREPVLSEGAVASPPANVRAISSAAPGARWTSFFGRREQALADLSAGRPRRLDEYLKIRRGIATGANAFFVLPQATVERWGIEPEHLARVVASARDLPDGELTDEHWQRLRAQGRPCWLLDVRATRAALAGTRVLRYLEHGEASGVDGRFNCRTRNPWYRQETAPPPDVIVTYMNRGPTRFVANGAGCRVMSVFLNGYLRPGGPPLGPLLAALRSGETGELIKRLGRTYGGGLGKIEPGDLSAVPLPELSRAPLRC
jgi:alpha-ketoglutarate-dependent taurine dioxygenase/tRNA1(Val) A37 N6-methylase TrmN6